MTQGELVKAWGISKGQVSKYVRAGMPLTSRAEAEAWRRDNQKNVTKNCLAGVRQEARLKEEIDPSPNENTEAQAILDRAKVAEAKAYDLMLGQIESKSFINARAAIAGYHEAVKMLRTAQEAKNAEQAHLRQTLSISEVEEVFSKTLGGIRGLLEAMPSSIAVRANPSDPECAKKAAEDYVNQIYLAIQKSEGAFA